MSAELSDLAECGGATTVAFTGGYGFPFELLAHAAASRFGTLNNIPVNVLTPINFMFDQLRSPHWMKAFLWDLVPSEVTTIIWFDCDIVPRRPLGPIPDGAFCAVVDLPAVCGIEPCIHNGAVINPYFNSGMFIARRKSIPVFEALARSMVSRGDTDRYEQTCFNIAVKENLGGFTPLPLSWNWFWHFYDRITGRSEDPTMVHFIQKLGKARWSQLAECYKSLGIVLPSL